MTLKDFFVGRAAVFGVLLLIGFGIFAYKAYAPVPVQEKNVQTAQPAGPLTFSWRFEDADSLNPDGNPETRVLLNVTHPDGTEETKLVGTAHASCSELPDADQEAISSIPVIQCYGAGLGYRFRIVEGETAYLVQRKEFEEASPEYEPPVQEYETILEVPNAHP